MLNSPGRRVLIIVEWPDHCRIIMSKERPIFRQRNAFQFKQRLQVYRKRPNALEHQKRFVLCNSDFSTTTVNRVIVDENQNYDYNL